MAQLTKKDRRIRRATRARAKIREIGTARLTVHRTPRHIYAQVTTADGARVLVAASTVQEAVAKDLKGTGNAAAAAAVGRAIAERFGGEVPRTMEELLELPGVARKTANVVLGTAFGLPTGVVVDTHVQRLAQRLGWTRETEPERIERDLMELFPRESWDPLAHVLIFHGRRVCTARAPACAACCVSDACPSAFHAETIGRKPPRAPR